ncbi:Hypothetical protein NCS54_00424000 [Fusarium falciforme]|nr:Hypothetical protein NCS54_00424000 [Fusarium falciforme]WAO86949.1 Hypothetical protein NCS54_00424000 [Fusarium falciforme]
MPSRPVTSLDPIHPLTASFFVIHTPPAAAAALPSSVPAVWHACASEPEVSRPPMSSVGSPITGLSPRSRRSSSMDQSPPGQPPTNTIEVDSDLNDTDSTYPESEAATDGMSLRSSILNYKWENSRRYHAYKDGSYWAPNDEQQQDAEDLIEFADEHPSAAVLGIDLSPIQPNFVPPNCRFKVDDVNDDWTFGENHFDFIHIRAMIGCVPDWVELHRKSLRSLRPGGWVEQVELSAIAQSEDNTIRPDSPLITWKEIFEEVGKLTGKTFMACETVGDAIREAGYVNVTERRIKLPIGMWPKDKQLKQWGAWNRQYLLQGLEGFSIRGLIELLGWSVERVQEFLDEMQRELLDSRVHSYLELAHARTLANVVFSQPTTPWEREIPLGKDLEKDVGSNKLPYMGVLTFSDEELLLDPEAYKGFGFKEEYELSTEYGSIVTTASRPSDPGFPIKSALNAPGASKDFSLEDHLSLLVLDSEIFKKVFRAYGDDNRPVWNGNADLSKFAFMASTQDSGSGFTASSFADDSDVHKISLSADEVTGQYVGLVSLHAWEWIAVPDTASDFGQIMTNLGDTIGPLFGPYSDQVKGGPSEALAWSKARAEEGYVLKPHTDITGAQTRVLMRGPLIPVEPSEDPTEAFSLYGEGLARFDKKTGIPDVSYKSAWTLGRSMMMADRAVSASLLRLRGNIHSEAVRRAKAKALYQKGYGILSNRDIYLAGLEDAVKHLQKAQDVSGIHKRNAADRWARPDNSNLPVMRLSNDTSYTIADYQDQIDQVTLHMFGYESKDAEGNPVPVRQIDADAATIRAWAVDRFLLAGVPMHSLILDPEMLPEESIRTFCVDNNWIDWLVDGGLSLANHFARDDDAIRRSFKECINTYLNTPMDGGTIPQLPRWGFLMRSTAVSAFPDLKVEAPLPENAPHNARQVQFMQVLAEDVLVCLFDRLPGEQEFSYIRISQPHHQQGFCLGKSLSDSELQVYHRPVPEKIGQNVGSTVGEHFEDKDTVLGLDFKARMLRPAMYMKKYHEAIKDREGAYKGASDSSLLLATQLRTYNLRLQLNAESDKSHGVSSSHRWTKAAFKLSTGSRPGPGTEESGKESAPPESRVRAPPSSNVALPTGPRVRIHPPISPYDFEAKSSIQKKPQTLHELESSNTLPYSATPLHVNCCLCYEPGNTSNIIYAPETPTDLIFNISAEESSGLPAEVELRIPVALSSGIYPPKVKDGSRGVIVIPGTGNQPITPALEDLSPSEWWSFDHKLATSSLYSFIPEALPDEGDSIPIETGKLVMLIIKIEPRLKGLVAPQTTSFKTSFLLRGVTFLLPKPKPDPSADWPAGPSRDARFDLLWRPSSPSRQTSVRTTQLTIRPATIATLEDEKINFDLNTQTLNLVFFLSRLPPSGAQARLIVTRQGVGKPFEETFELPKDPKSDPDGRGYRYSSHKVISKLGYFVPRETRLTIVAPDNGRMLGPDSAPFVFSQVPSREDLQGSCSFYWGWDHHISIIWPPLNTAHVPVNHKIAIISRLQGSSKPELSREPTGKEKEIVRFKGDELKDYGNESLGLTIKVTITVDDTSIHGTVVEWVANLSTMPTVKETVEEHGMAVTTRLENPGPAPPVSTSRFQSMRFWSESGTAGFKTDMWYWRDSKRLAGIRWNASEATAYEEAGPNVPQSKPDLTGAGALAVIQMHQDRRFKIVWIGNDGSVNLWSRENEGMGPENWSYGVLAPPGSASTLGGGCLAACGEVPVKEPRPRRNPVI